MIELRPYQAAAVDKIMWSMKMDGNDLVVLPTGAGKSIVIAETARRVAQLRGTSADVPCDILITQPNREILEQNVGKLLHYVDAKDVGVFSDSLKQKSVRKYTFATIGSIYKRPHRFAGLQLMLVDECDLVNFRRAGTMYKTFIDAVSKANRAAGLGPVKVVGYTATPYRIVSTSKPTEWDPQVIRTVATLKLINRMAPMFWNRLLVNVNNAELVRDGYLVPLTYENVQIVRQEDLELNNAETDFKLEAYEEKLGSRERQVVDRIKLAVQQFGQVLMFNSSVKQAEKFARVLDNAYCVSAKTPGDQRAAIIDGFRAGKISAVFNVGVLTTGFDHPSLGCIALSRPTKSLRLYYQMLGRGVRTSPGKERCHVIDFSDTVNKLGPIESITLSKGKELGDKWELTTETGSWHNAALYSWLLKRPAATQSAVPAKRAAPIVEPSLW